MGVDAGRVVGERKQRIRMGQGDGPRVEVRVVLLAVLFRRGHLQHDRLRRDLDRRHRDLVLVAEVADRLHVRIAHVEIERVGGQRRHALDLNVVLSLVPERGERRRADGDELQRTADDPVVHDARSRDLDPADLDIAQPLGLGVLLDQLVAFHQHQRQEAHAVLLRDVDLCQLGARRCSERGEQQAQETPPDDGHRSS